MPDIIKLTNEIKSDLMFTGKEQSYQNAYGSDHVSFSLVVADSCEIGDCSSY